MFQQRPCSPPISLDKKPPSRLKQHGKRNIKDFQLCAWSDGSPPCSIRPAMMNSNQHLRKLRTSNQHHCLSKSKPSKWYLGRTNKDSKLNFECPFQHHTDTTNYMKDYRQQKMNHIHLEYADEIQNFWNAPNDFNQQIDDAITHDNKNGNVSQIQSSTAEGRHFNEESRPLSLHGLETRILWKPKHINHFNIRGKLLEQEEENKNLYKQRKEKESHPKHRYLNLPKCGSVFTTPPLQSTFHAATEQSLKCQQLTELTIQKAPQNYDKTPSSCDIGKSTTDSSAVLKIHKSIRQRSDNLKLRSADETARAPRPFLASTTKQQNNSRYNHIIRKVLEHYDSSQNAVRARVSNYPQQTHSQQASKSLLATT